MVEIMEKHKVILTGGTGFLGSAFRKFANDKNYDCIIFTTNPKKAEKANHIFWDGKNLLDNLAIFKNTKAVINFAGKNINCRFTEKNKREIISSRVASASAVNEVVAELKPSELPEVLVQCAGASYYGDSYEIHDENSSPTKKQTFLSEVCRLWEEAFWQNNLPSNKLKTKYINCSKYYNCRKCLLRIGMVLGKDGGALPILMQLTKFFLGGKVASGKQYVSWIHIRDLMRMIDFCISNDKIHGNFNAVSPNPVTNKEFMQTLRSTIVRPWSPPVPKFALKLTAPLLGTDASLALASMRCYPKRMLESGFDFNFPKLKTTLSEIKNSL